MEPSGIEWSDEPAEVSVGDLRWSLLYGRDQAGSVRWVLRERLHDEVDTFFIVKIVRHTMTSSELAEHLTPIVGRPIADTLVEEVSVRLPDAVIRDR